MNYSTFRPEAPLLFCVGSFSVDHKAFHRSTSLEPTPLIPPQPPLPELSDVPSQITDPFLVLSPILGYIQYVGLGCAYNYA